MVNNMFATAKHCHRFLDFEFDTVVNIDKTEYRTDTLIIFIRSKLLSDIEVRCQNCLDNVASSIIDSSFT